MSTDIARVDGELALELTSGELQGLMTADEWTIIERFMAKSGDVWLCYHDQTILCCVLGLIPPTLLSNQAYLWLYATPAMANYTLPYVMHSKSIIAEMLSIYPRLFGHCECQSPSSIRWLKWLGAKFGEPQGALVPFQLEAV